MSAKQTWRFLLNSICALLYLSAHSMSGYADEIEIDSPNFLHQRPTVAVSLYGAVSTLGGRTFSSSQSVTGVTSAPAAVGLQMEIEPRFIQSIGIISLGADIAMYPIFPDGAVTNSRASFYSLGGVARYQLRLFDEQLIVPTAAFYYQMLYYSMTTGQSGSFAMMGPAFGGLIYLNFFDRENASDFYVNQGALRSYLLAEYKLSTGSDSLLSVAGGSFFFGLRIEF